MLISLFIHFITEIRKYREFGLNNNLAERRIGRWSYLVCYVLLLLLFVCFYRCLHVPFRCFITSFCVSEIVSVTFSSHSYLSICLLFTFSQHKSVVGWSSFLSDLQIFNYIYIKTTCLYPQTCHDRWEKAIEGFFRPWWSVE